jgi:hypothetical protein
MEDDLIDVPKLSIKDQLVLTAAASGYKILKWEKDIPTVRGENGVFEWKPHLDDGHSRRLQVLLGINLIFDYENDQISVECPLWKIERLSIKSPNDEDEDGNDSYAITRELVLLCASSVYSAILEQGF